MARMKHWTSPWARALAFGTAALLILLALGACTQAPPDSDDDDEDGADYGEWLVEAVIDGTVSLPAAASVAVTDLTVSNALGEAAVGADGTFELTILLGGPHLAMAQTQTGAPVLLGWLSNRGTTLSVRSTAEVMLYFASGAYAGPPEAMVAMVELLAAHPDLEPLTSTLAEVLAQDPAALEAGDGRIAAATAATLATLGTPVDSSSVLVDPPEGKSGIVVDLPGLNDVQLTNHYRRRAAAFIDQVSYRADDGETVPLVRRSVAEQEISPTTRLTSVVAALADAINGLHAYSPVAGEPIALAVHPADAVRSMYRLTVVGPGGSVGGMHDLTPQQLATLRDLWLETVVIDFLVPIATNVVVPLNKEGIEDFLNALNGHVVVKDFIKLLFDTAPKVWEKAAAGDLRGAVVEAWTAVGRTATLKVFYVAIMPDLLHATLGIDAYHMFKVAYGPEGIGTVLDKTMSAFDTVLVGVDGAVQVGNIVSSTMVETWDLDVNRSTVKLSPERSWITPYHPGLVLTATVPEATGRTPPVLAYHWTSTSTAGGISDGTQYGQDFDSSKNSVTYLPFSSLDGGKVTETVTVEVFEVVGSERVSLGTAQATVNVRTTQPVIVPKTASIEPGGSQTFRVNLNPPVQGSPTIFYRWQASEEFGTVDAGLGLGVLTTAASVTYTADGPEEGSDEVSVEVFAMENGELLSLGGATATALVEEEPTVFEGSWIVHTDTYTQSNGTPRNCAAVYITFERVPDAVTYEVYGYNFFDPYFFGDDLRYTVAERSTWPGYDTACADLHAVGDLIRLRITVLHTGSDPDLGYYQGRFAGMIVEVRARFK